MAPRTQNNKRPAPAGGATGGDYKKRTFDKGGAGKPGGNKPYDRTGKFDKGKFDKGKGKPKYNKDTRGGAAKPEEIKKRKQPLSGRVPELEAGEDDDYEVVPGEEDDAMDVDPKEGKDDKKRLTKDERAALHAQQPHRTSLLPSHPLLQDTLLPLWETARKADLSKEERKVAVHELYEAVKGRVKEVGRGHKGGRVLQTIVKYGGKVERDGVAKELEGQYREMMMSKYSKFLMSKIIRYCPSIRPSLIAAISPQLQPLIFHTFACSVIADFFELYATPKEKRLLVRGFYPREVQIFDGAKGEKGLEALLEETTETKGRERILEQLEKTVIEIFNSTQKQALAQAVFHRVALEYLTCIYKFLSAGDADKKMHELLAAALESLPEIVHTKDGSAIAREFLARGTAKDRKSILQQLKKHLEAMCMDAEAQMVLFTAFDVVDDTKLMGKAIISDIVALAPQLALDKQGRRVLLYLVVPRATRHFIPSTIAQLAISDEHSAATSKKAADTRRAELKAAASEGLLKAVEDNAEAFLRDAGASLLVTEVLLYADGDKENAMEALLRALQTPYPDPAPVEDADPETAHILDLSFCSRLYKTLLAGGHYSTSTKQVDVVDADRALEFAQGMWLGLTSEEAGGEASVVNIAKGNGTFVLAELVEALKRDPELFQEVKRVLDNDEAKAAIRANVRKGTNVLLEKIEGTL